MDASVVDRARALSGHELATKHRRWTHVQGVATTAIRTVTAFELANGSDVVAAAWLHDIGYGPAVKESGFHPVDGAEFVQKNGFDSLVVSLVAHHSGAAEEAVERGLSARLAAFAVPPVDLLDILTFADMTTGTNGESVRVEDRVAEILKRYKPTNAVHRAVTKSAPGLFAIVERVQQRLAPV